MAGYAGYAGAGYPSYAAGARPVVYQYTRPSTYEVGTAYSYGGSNGNPLTSFLQGSWLPWANRQPAQQPQPVVAAYAQQPQQPQQPLQAFWNFLPWHGPNSAQQAGHPQQSGPVVSFLQNPSALLPWASSRPTVQYVTPLAPSTAAHSMQAMQAMQQAAPAGSVSALHVSTQPGAAPAEATLSASIKPLDASDADALVQEVPADVADNGVRRIAVQAVHQDDVPCA